MNKEYLSLDVCAFENMLASGFNALREHEEDINRLNVFPVPDGDTGVNMRMTMESGLAALRSGNASTVSEAAAVFARGALLGARGNSGVILSQIFKGIALGLDGKKTADVSDVRYALARGVERSYKAVVKPVEGTILTVFREGVENMSEKEESLNGFFRHFNKVMQRSLKDTPEKLPVLKKANVVDSGGAGLVCIFGGFSKFLGGEQTDGNISTQPMVSGNAFAGEAAVSDAGEEFGYCTEFLLNLREETKETFEVEQLVSRLESIGGESIVALRDGDMVKVHVHVETPGDALNIAQQYGDFISVKIENMTLQHNEVKSTVEKERVPVALVTVVGCDGFKDIFFTMGADYVVNGGQSMNPSVEDFIVAFQKVNASDVIVLPNNSNVLLTAKQAGEMFKASRVHVIETKSLSQGYSALSLYNPESEIDETVADMNGAKDSVISIELTRAVRDAELDGFKIRTDDYMAITDGKVSGLGKSYPETFACALENAGAEDKSTITIFEGEDAADTDGLISVISKKYPDLEVNSVRTEQKIYAYIIAIE